ncbi:MAG: SIMPL domain-containing protein [Mariniblastus sp.]|nr:SIMPL domain-containing protein [Mariniblastus sp.]
MTKMFLPITVVLLAIAPLQAEERKIQVTAQSQIKVTPDEVYLDFRIESRREELLDAKKANDELALKVFGIAKDHGIPSADVSVFDMDLAPVYKRDDNDDEKEPVRKPIAFRYLRSMEVRMTDFNSIEPFLVECYKVGVQDLSGVSFRVSNQREHQFRAREMAVTYCREKATHLTELTGMKLGSPISIREDVERNYEAGGYGGGGVFGASAEVDRSPLPGDEEDAGRPGTLFVSFNSLAELQEIDLVAPGQVEISAKVTIIYDMTKDE